MRMIMTMLATFAACVAAAVIVGGVLGAGVGTLDAWLICIVTVASGIARYVSDRRRLVGRRA